MSPPVWYCVAELHHMGPGMGLEVCRSRFASSLLIYFPSLCPRLLLDEKETGQFGAECLGTLTFYCPLDGKP